jgi:hypothetical protein
MARKLVLGTALAGFAGLALAVATGLVWPAADAEAQATSPPAAGTQPDGKKAAPAKPAAAAQPKWDSFPTMVLEQVFRGPLQDTVIQRWRDPIDGMVCYTFVPISTPFQKPPGAPYVQYQAPIGTISCAPSARPFAMQPQ